MKKLIISSLWLFLIFQSSGVVQADSLKSYEGEGDIGFTGTYNPPFQDDMSKNGRLTLPEKELSYLPGGYIPNAGDTSNNLYIYILGVSGFGIAFYSLQLRKKVEIEKNRR